MSAVTPAHLVKLGDLIAQNRKNFLNILTRLSTYKAAQEEIDHSLETLYGAAEELKGLNGYRIRSLSAYLPPNVILFSYILYIAIPSAFCDHIYFRPSVRAREETHEIHIKINELLPLPAKISYTTRKLFFENFTQTSDVIVFTGRCQNGDEVASQIKPHQLFMYFGSGVNPFVVGPSANIEQAANDAVTIRLNNSGQDCLCPDLYLLHSDIADSFLEKIKHNLNKAVFGERTDPLADYSYLSYPDVAEFCFDYLEENRKYIIYGGEVNILERYVSPTILLRNINQIDMLPEFFAPIFNMAIYENDQQIAKLIESDIYKDKAMGVMLYGASNLESIFNEKHFITFDSTLFQINHGNNPFGGWDKCASHIRFQGQVISKPLLISDVVRTYLKNS